VDELIPQENFSSIVIPRYGRYALRKPYLMSFARSDLSAVAQRAKAEATEVTSFPLAALWIASRSLSSGAHSRDPLARNDATVP
jgi:hypothetical protein